MRGGVARGFDRGFALVLTMALLALLVLALYALSILVRVNARISTATSYQLQASQHARIGLAQAVAVLQQLAGPDDRVTAMAGIAGVEGGSQQRHWCGVWTAGGEFLGWLTSGASSAAAPAFSVSTIVSLVQKKTVGTKPGTLSAYVDEEYVDAGKIVITVPGPLGPVNPVGAYAYWVGDEGVKVSALAPPAQWPPGGTRISTASSSLNIARMGVAYQEFDSLNAPRLLAYEQATNLLYASGSNLTASNLQDSFHHVTLTHRTVAATGELYSGQVNINTTSAVVWRSLVEGYELAPGATAFGAAAKRTEAINTLAEGIAASASGKNAYSPFLTVASFLGGALLDSAVTGANGITVEEFATVLAPMLTVRSDTFRIRAYGEALNPLDPAKIEATAYCEAIVQRTATTAPSGVGRAFVVTYFRWLGPDDI